MKKIVTTIALGFIVAGLASCCASAPKEIAGPPVPEGPVTIEK